jgi:hypothetical protein
MVSIARRMTAPVLDRQGAGPSALNAGEVSKAVDAGTFGRKAAPLAVGGQRTLCSKL